MHLAYKLPVSVKGIVFVGDKVFLRKNERNEWELPGGKLDPGEQPEETVRRELREELGFEVSLERLVGANVLNVTGSLDEESGVLILIYQCKFLKKVGEFEIQGEAGTTQFQAFSLAELINLQMPQFYITAIQSVI
jgi:8-oxo-dGTP pyrophosphatase MutT (NUDIX family)